MPETRRAALTAFFAMVAASAGRAAAQPLPQVASGRIERMPDFASRHVAPRHVDVWRPSRCAANTPKRPPTAALADAYLRSGAAFH